MEILGQGGIIMAADTGAVYQIKTPFSVPQIQNEVASSEWAPWGVNNLQGTEMATRIENCGVLNSAIEAKSRIAVGVGLRPVFITGIGKNGEEELEFVNDEEINQWLEFNSIFYNSLQSIRNMIGWGWSHDRFILDNDGKKIARWQTDDVVKCRMQRINKDTGKINYTGISADWSQTTSDDPKNLVIKKVEMLDERNELDDLKERITAANDVREYSMITRGHLNGKHYYPNPLWWSTREWVDMDILVPGMKLAMMKNQMTIKYIITIDEAYFKNSDDKWDGYTSVEKNQKFLEKSSEINLHLAGNDKAYKSITTQSYIDPRTNTPQDYIRIQVIDDKTKDGKLLVDTGAANKEILFSMMMNPAIIGANTFGGEMSGGAGSGSDIREAYLVQIMLMESERQSEYRKMNIIKNFNGWALKFPGKNLQFRYPNMILTTLDTGGSTAPVVPGAKQNTDQN